MSCTWHTAGAGKRYLLFRFSQKQTEKGTMSWEFSEGEWARQGRRLFKLGADSDPHCLPSIAQVSLDLPGGIPEEKGKHLEQREPATH